MVQRHDLHKPIEVFSDGEDEGEVILRLLEGHNKEVRDILECQLGREKRARMR